MGNPALLALNAGHGTTPSCESTHKRGDVVKVRRTKALADFPPEAVVICVVPPHFSPDYAVADMFGEPRPLMIREGSRCVTYILAREGDPQHYIARDKHLIATGETVQIGSVSRA